MTYRQLLEHWPLIEADLQDAGVDVGDEHLMRTRTWRWLRVRILGLLSRPPAWDTALLPNGAVQRIPRFATRIQDALWPPQITSDQQFGLG